MYAGPVVPDDWDRRVWLAGTERSPNYGGYLEGALESAEQSVTSLLRAWPTLANAGEITT